MNKNLQEPTTQVSARRKLIRGAFSVPAVLAVHNGSALAASSNKMQCAVKALSNLSYPASSVGVGVDSWIRVQRYKQRGTGVPYVKMSDIRTVATALGGIVVAINATTEQSIRWSDGEIASINNLDIDTPNQVALRFDANGAGGSIRIVGIVTQAQSLKAASGTNAIATSCWNSMM